MLEEVIEEIRYSLKKLLEELSRCSRTIQPSLRGSNRFALDNTGLKIMRPTSHFPNAAILLMTWGPERNHGHRSPIGAHHPSHGDHRPGIQPGHLRAKRSSESLPSGSQASQTGP
jgi:hypothetical protein